MKWWIILILISIALIVLGSMIIFPQNPAHNLVLQYIYTLVSWPLIILVLGLVLLIKFKEPISEWIKTFLVKTPKGYLYGAISQFETKPLKKGKLKEVKKILGEEITGYMELVHFERIIRMMYRSQFRLLEKLKAVGSLTPDKAFSYYHEFLKQGGNKDYTVSFYIDWLKNITGLIKINEKDDVPAAKLTERGNSFILYCNLMNYSENTFMPL